MGSMLYFFPLQYNSEKASNSKSTFSTEYVDLLGGSQRSNWKISNRILDIESLSVGISLQKPILVEPWQM